MNKKPGKKTRASKKRRQGQPSKKSQPCHAHATRHYSRHTPLTMENAKATRQGTMEKGGRHLVVHDHMRKLVKDY